MHDSSIRSFVNQYMPKRSPFHAGVDMTWVTLTQEKIVRRSLYSVATEGKEELRPTFEISLVFFPFAVVLVLVYGMVPLVAITIVQSGVTYVTYVTLMP